MEKLRDHLKYRVESEGDNEPSNLTDRLRATEDTLTQLYADVALDDPRVRSYFAENLRALVPREIGPADQLPEQVRETAALLEAAMEAAGATPVDAESHFLQANALYLSSERLEGTAITKALRDAIKAYDQALEVYTRQALPQNWAMTLNNKGISLGDLGVRLEGEAGTQALRDAIEAYDQALEVYTRQALPQNWAMTLNNKGIALGNLGERLEGEVGAQALQGAIDAFDLALEVYTRHALPQDWAMTLNNKGAALSDLGERLEGEAGAQALQDAIEAFDLALEVYTRAHHPFHHVSVGENRARARRLLADKTP